MTFPQPQTDFEDNLPPPSFEPPPKKRRWLWLLLTLLLFAGGAAIAWIFLRQNPTPPTAKTQPQGVRVKLSAVQIGPVEESSDFIASLESRRSLKLQSKIPGQVTQIFVKPGDAVTTGALIAQVDFKPQPAVDSGISTDTQVAAVQLESIRTALKSLEDERRTKVADVELNRREYQRYASLAAQGAVPRQTSEQYANTLAATEAQLTAIDHKIQAQRAIILQAEKALQQNRASNQQQVQIQNDKITAPFTGIISEISVKTGDLVNTSTQLATISQNQPLEVKISVPLELETKLRKGMPVEVMNAQGEKLGNSRIFFIAPNITNKTRTLQLKALFNNPKGQLRADQLVRAKVIWNQRPGVLIPKTAVSRVGGETFVYIAEIEKSPQGLIQQVARRKQVKLGNSTGNNYQVITGLQPQDKIIVSGLLDLKDGVSIVTES